MSNSNRPFGMSQLDYLWLNFGGYTIGTDPTQDPKENNILSELAVRDLIQKSTGGGIISLDYREHPTDESLMQLIGTNVEGKQLAILDMPKEVHVESFVSRKVTQKDIDNGCTFDIHSDVLSIKLTNGKEYLLSLQDVVARGSQTDTVITDVTKGIINSHVKIDTANNELSVVELKKSQQGLYPYLKINNENSGVQLIKTNLGLRAKIPVGEYEIKFRQMSFDEYCLIEYKDPGTVYFMTDKPYFYLGTQKYGIDIHAGMSIVSSLKYNPNTMTMTYTTTDASAPVDIPLGPANAEFGGMMSKDQYMELQQLNQALNGITSIEDYVKQHTSNLGAKINKVNSSDGKSTVIQLLDSEDNVLSSTEIERENYVTSVIQRKALPEDVTIGESLGMTFKVGDNIIVYNMKNKDRYYLDLGQIVVNYKFANSPTVLFTNVNNEISANLNLNDNKIVYVDPNGGIDANIEILRDENYIYIYGKSRTQRDLIGKFKSPRRNLNTAYFFPNITVEQINTYQPHFLDWKVYEPDTNPVIPGEDYYVLEYEDLIAETTKNYYISISNIASGIKISTKTGNLIRYDEEGALFAALEWTDAPNNFN